MSDRIPEEDKYVSSLLLAHLNDGIYEYRNDLLGKILTIVDASFSDPEQKKAVKDLIKEVFYSGNHLDRTGSRHTIASLAQFLRKFNQERSEKSEKKYMDYLGQNKLEIFGRNPTIEGLEEAELG